MSICEDQTEAARPPSLPGRSRRYAGSIGRLPTCRTAIESGRVDDSCKALHRQVGTTRRDELAFYKTSHTARNAAPHPQPDPCSVDDDVTDTMLLRNVAEGDKAAMHIIFARHRARVFRFVNRMIRNPAIAEDIVSQVFLDVWRSASRFENRARVITWLISIARFQSINAIRTRRHESVDQDHILAIADNADTPDVALDRKETSGTLLACMEKLSPAHREIIDLLYLREKSIVEASGMIGIPQATVKSRAFYARKHLARILVDAGLEGASEPQCVCDLAE